MIQKFGSHARAVTTEDAAKFGEVVLEAIPYGLHESLPAEALAGKILISASNYYPQRDGTLNLGGRAQTELLAHQVPKARVVKAFNTIHWEHLRDQGDTSKLTEARRVIFLSGDDEAAKRAVAVLIEELGLGPFELGSLREGKRQELESAVYNKDMTVKEARAFV